MSWIKCSDKLPDDKEDKIIFSKTEGKLLAYYDKKEQEWFAFYGDSYIVYYVTHWQPLPNDPEA